MTNSVQISERSELISIISDTYKMAYGVRPRSVYDYDSMSITDLQNLLNELVDVANEAYDEEQKEAEHQVELFKQKVDNLIQIGAGDEETALRWLLDGSDIDTNYQQDIELFVWQQGILYTDYGKKLLEKLLDMKY